MALSAPGRTRHREHTSEVRPLLYLAVGAAWALVAVGVWRQARRDEARRKVRAISARLLAQVFPNGVAP